MKFPLAISTIKIESSRESMLEVRIECTCIVYADATKNPICVQRRSTRTTMMDDANDPMWLSRRFAWKDFFLQHYKYWVMPMAARSLWRVLVSYHFKVPRDSPEARFPTKLAFSSQATTVRVIQELPLTSCWKSAPR